MIAAAAGTQGESSRNSAGLHQERSKNDRGHSRNEVKKTGAAVGTQGEHSRSPAGMQQKRRAGGTAGTQQEFNRNSAWL